MIKIRPYLLMILTVVLILFCSVLAPAFNYDNIDIAIQDQHTEIVDLHVSVEVDTATLINATSIDDLILYIETTGAVPGVGNIVCLKEELSFYQAEMLAVTPIIANRYTVLLDTPLDFAFSTAGGCSIRSKNLAVNGAAAATEFIVSPGGMTKGMAWDITRMMVHIQSTGAMDDGLFGDEPALVNGVVFRTVNGTTKNLFNAKTNGQFAMHAYDREYSSKAPAGKTAVTIRRSFNGFDKNGVTLRLDADTNDTFMVIIQDDLTGLDHMHVIVQGHVVLP